MLKRYHLSVPYHFKLNIYKSMSVLSVSQIILPLEPHPKYTDLLWHSCSFQGNSLWRGLKLEVSLGTPSPVLLTSDCCPCPPGLRSEVSLCLCGSWYSLLPPSWTAAAVLSILHLALCSAAKIIFWKKKINPVLSVSFKTSFDALLPTE